MFKIEDRVFPCDDKETASYLNNWPMLYILENGRQAYVGQTNSIVQRMIQHRDSASKKIFNKAHYIYSDEFNQSATFDYESRLIALMSADGKYTIKNRNGGMSGVNYYDKSKYDDEFAELWKELQRKNLAVNSIDEIEQSDIFKYSPYKKLNQEQRETIADIMNNLEKSLDRKIVVRGMPGSGKTIVAIYLFKLLRETPQYKNLKIGFVVPPTSLRSTMKTVFKSVDNLSANDVYGPNEVANEKFDILIVDEAHRLKARKNLTSYKKYDEACAKMGLPTSSTQLDWILHQTRCAIFFSDENQIVFPAGLNVAERIKDDTFDKRMLAYYTLFSQMRCKAGEEYLKDIYKMLDGTLDHKVFSYGYDLCLVKKFADFEEQYREKEKEFGLTRMMAGYAWEWKSKGGKDEYDIEIEGHKLKWNAVTENWVHTDNAVNEVGCIHSTQGYDLNYGFVIIGNDIRYDEATGRIVTVRDNYYDKYGKYGATDVELDKYIKNIYYVLLTRGIIGTYIYVCDEPLRKYMEKYLPVM